jgi:photosystem II stability/assembly factor-like uncharacterized protein
MLRHHAVTLAATVVLASGSARAIAYGNAPLTVTLAQGITAQRHPRSCGYWQLYGAGCVAWTVAGMPVPPDLLDRATLFTTARGGRIVLAHSSGVAFTDDRGAHWSAARWEGAQGPLSVAFDATSDFGVAVGRNGGVWTSEDRGATWRSRRDAAGQTLVDVAVIGRTIAFSDDHGGVWVSTDGGTSVRTLSDPAASATPQMPRMTVHERAIWVLVGGSVWWRADASGTVERVDHAPVPRD